jgi:alkylation response protein AidB-like acyl-CoA dehydrogenase
MKLSETELLLRDTLREFAQKELAPRAKELDRSGGPIIENFRKMADLGILGLAYPEEYGGSSAGYRSYILALEEIARVCASTAITLLAHSSLCTYPIFAFGNEAQKRKFVQQNVKGEKIGAFALTEPNAGSDAAGIETLAKRVKGGYTLSGTKMFITNGSIADTFVVAATLDRTKRAHGITLFIVEKTPQTKGFIVAKKEDKLGLRASDTCELVFEELFVPEENRLGEECEGFKILMNTLDVGRIAISAISLGIAEGAFLRALDYSKERRQFEKPISSFQAIEFMLADMSIEIEAARALIARALELKEDGKPFTKESAIAKVFSSEMAMRVTKNAIQIHGGYGYMDEYEVERFYRDAKLYEIGEGTSEIQRIVIARQILKEENPLGSW